MGLLRSTIMFFIQIYVAAGITLPMLPGNRLLTGSARDLPDAKLINCQKGPLIVTDFKRTQILNPSTALTQSKFQTNPFTAHSVVPGPLVHGGVGKFSFAEVKPESSPKPVTVYGLQVDGSGRSGESAYWLPQGGHIDIPATPEETVTPATKYVFTPDFSGCSWTVTPLPNGDLRLRHVEGGKEEKQFNDLPEAEKGGKTTYAMQYTDYGYIRRDGQLISNVPAYAYMHFSNGRWSIYVQHQTCAPRPGNCAYDRNRLLENMKMNFYNQDTYAMISGIEIFTVPNVH